jgi:hypothetical protein
LSLTEARVRKQGKWKAMKNLLIILHRKEKSV